MKKILPEEIPVILTQGIIDILARMADEFPQSEEWQLIFKNLSSGDLMIIMDRKIELQKEDENKTRALMTQDEKRIESESWKKIKEDPNPRFAGNMGEPETQEEYVRKYGVWPGGKIDE